MFGGRFGRTRFNLRNSSLEIKLSAVLLENLSGVAANGADFYLKNFTMMGQMFAQTSGDQGLPVREAYGESLFTSPDITGGLLESFFLESSIQNQSAAGADIGSFLGFQEDLQNRVAIAADVSFLYLPQEWVDGEWRLGANIWCGWTAAEILSGLLDAGALEEQETLITVQIPPGGELRIDSEYYTVTLNGKNILHLQEGDWIKLDRDLKSIVIDTGTGGQMTGEIIYTERYL